MNQDYLISKDSKGKIRVVNISYDWDKDLNGYVIRRFTSQYGGKITTQPIILVDKGKGIGKARRTVSEQAKLEYDSRVNKYMDKGYKKLPKSIDLYTKEELDALLPEETTDSEGNLKPMLAKDFHDVATSVLEKQWWYASRKIDGVRCLMFVKDGEIHTSSRGGKNYDNSTYHITCNPKLKKFMLDNPTLILDGELYVHGYSLQTLSGLARLKKETDKCDELQYYIYDVVDTNKTFEERLEILDHIKDELQLDFEPNKTFEDGDLQIQMVPHVKVEGWVQIKKTHDSYVKEGFEGAVIRRPDKKYGVNKRTNDMVKVKEYQDGEFKIIGFSEGLRPEDMVFVCVTEDGKEFEAKPVGPRELKHEYLERIDEIIGKMATVKYFSFSDGGTPTQPVLKCIRDYE
jgi:ATP-dependent DNA ligase|nr:MAG TPA: adenylation DNA ligase-like protein [Bacteriophage sp.]